MNQIEKLLVNLCPNGVTYKKLENCCNILDNKRKPVTKSARIQGKYPYYGANGIQDYVSDYLFDGKFILVGEDGSVINENGNPIVTWAEGRIWVNNHAHIIEEIDGVLLRYLFHYLQTVNVKSLIHGNIPKLNQKDFRELLIAIPPLEIQYKIINILDNFTSLLAELRSELKARQKQYEYYFDKILNNNIYPKMKLGDIGQVKMCKRILKSQTNTSNGIPFYKIGTFGKEPHSFIDEKTFEKYKEKYSYPKKGDILISCSGTIGKTIIFDGKPSYFQDSNIVWIQHDNTNIINEFLFYCYQTNPWTISTGGTISRLYNENILKAEIPVPPIKEQKKIVDKLNGFYKLCNNISEGIPAEIEARQKQYEYYRNKLLTFRN